MTINIRIAASVLASALLLTACGSGGDENESESSRAAGPKYPTRPITLIVPYGAGGAFDSLGRPLATALGNELGEPVSVVNVAGAAGTTGTRQAATAKADGYTLLYAGNTQLAIEPSRKGAAYSADDLTPVGQAVEVYNALVAGPGSPQTWDDLVKAAKADPGGLKYGTDGPGSATHLETEALLKEAGISMTMVPFTSGAEGIAAALNGSIDFYRGSVASVREQVNAKRLTGIYVTSAEKLDALPSVPSMTDIGFSQLSFPAWQAIFVPKGTDPQIVKALEGALKRATEDTTYREAAEKSGAAVIYKEPSEVQSLISSQSDVYARLLTDLRL